MSWVLPPAEKLPLAVRKNIRDEFESKKGEHEAKIATAMGVDSFTITVNANEVYPYAEARGSKDNMGYCNNSYFENLAEAVDKYTESGRDSEAAEALRKVLTKRTAVLKASDKVSYCGVAIVDGELQVLYKHDYYASNISSVGEKFAEVVDEALDAIGGDDLPIITRRAIATYFDGDEGKKAWQAKLKSMFGHDYEFEWDFRAIISKLPKDSWLYDRKNEAVPELVSKYFSAAIENLERKEFGKDDMLQEAFVEATEKRVFRLEVVDKLKHGSYNDTIFENGVFIIQVPTNYFGSNVYETGNEVINRL